jgi:glucose/arabinose dehydrogenase
MRIAGLVFISKLSKVARMNTNSFAPASPPGTLASFPGLILSLALLCVLPAAHAQNQALKLVAEGFTSPVALVQVPDGSKNLLVVDQIGTVRLVQPDGTVRPRAFLDVRNRLCKLNEGFDERGLLGLALHPKFNENGRVFVNYSAPLRPNAPKGWDHTSRISEYKVLEGDRLRVDPASERILLEFDQSYFNHNGGGLLFGPDGYLYIASGDGGNANDVGRRGPLGNGQDMTTLLGKILRIDVDKGDPYAIPADNPFKDGGRGLPEIYAFGLRNPWGMSFDRGGSRQLIASDVGQNMFEEINIIVKGGNYGWNIREGFACFDPKKANTPGEDCPKAGAHGEPLLDPVLVYKNSKAFPNDPETRGTSVTGGFIYRGKALPHLQGKYLFADWSRHWAKADGVIYVATPSESNPWRMEPLALANHAKGELGAYITAVGEDLDGELYFLTNASNSIVGTTGKVYKLVPQN